MVRDGVSFESGFFLVVFNTLEAGATACACELLVTLMPFRVGVGGLMHGVVDSACK